MLKRCRDRISDLCRAIVCAYQAIQIDRAAERARPGTTGERTVVVISGPRHTFVLLVREEITGEDVHEIARWKRSWKHIESLSSEA